ncbi:MAG TPA: peptidoglycan-associated lipoprotein Pal [Rhodocyclaceae bacterium]
MSSPLSFRSLSSILVLAAVLAACSSQPPAPEQLPSGVENRDPNAVAGRVGNSDGIDPLSMAALKDPRSPLSKREIFFDYDSYVVRDEYRPLVTAHAKFLAANAKVKMLVQGNADDRGSREYNLALGQKRAEALKKALLLLGGREDQIESVSLGEEKPRCEDQTESCWAQNRRDDILYTGEF